MEGVSGGLFAIEDSTGVTKVGCEAVGALDENGDAAGATRVIINTRSLHLLFCGLKRSLQ